MDRQAQAGREQGWSKNATIRQHLPCNGRSQHAREAVSRVYHDRLTSGLRLPLLLRWRELVGREGHGQGVSEASWQKRSNNKELTVLAWLRQPYLCERPCRGRQPRLLLHQPENGAGKDGVSAGQRKNETSKTCLSFITRISACKVCKRRLLQFAAPIHYDEVHKEHTGEEMNE